MGNISLTFNFVSLNVTLIEAQRTLQVYSIIFLYNYDLLLICHNLISSKLSLYNKIIFVEKNVEQHVQKKYIIKSIIKIFNKQCFDSQRLTSIYIFFNMLQCDILKMNHKRSPFMVT